MSNHISVLLKESIDGLNIKNDGIYVDLTLGRAGHFKEILHRVNNGLVIGLDQDDEAIKEASIILKDEKNKFILKKCNFKDIKEVLESLNISKIDGAIMDLGVSSPQFDEKERGFSYREDGILDMRMDQSQEKNAKDIVNNYSLNELTRVFREYGDEKYAYQIAKNIIKKREIKPIETTLELVEIIKASKPMKELKKVGHPAKQAFQALRIEVNDELNILKETIPTVLDLLKVGGRLAIITFHSGEDKIVKDLFKSYTVREGNRLNFDEKVEPLNYQLVSKHPIIPSDKEIEFNHRSKSSKLRIIERIR